MEIILNNEQKDALEALNEFLESPQNVFTLIGNAGRGKTFLIVEWLKQLGERLRIKVAVTAPTNRAVDVFRNKWDYSMTAPSFMTIHSLLGIREVIQPDGSLKFLPQQGEDGLPKINNYDIVVVDESSMVGEELLYFILKERVKIIFVGDDRQLTPVGETLSPALNVSFSQSFKLFTPVRQAAGSPILVAADTFPNTWDIQNYSNDSGEVKIIKSFNALTECLKEFTDNINFLNRDYFKILAWRNSSVDTLNFLIRSQLFGNDVDHFIEGDRIVAKGPCLFDGVIIAYASEELIVEKVVRSNYEITDSIIYGVYYLYCKNSRNKEIKLTVLHKEDEKNYFDLLKAVANYANIQIAKGVPPKIAWSNYYELKDMFHQVCHAYALTVHRAQGGTFENTIVCLSDFNLNKNQEERKRLFYTGVTRASKKLIIYHGYV